MARERLEVDQFNSVARAAFGRGRCLAGFVRQRGGSSKGVYRLAFDDDSTAVAYVWAPHENYWHGLGGDDGEDSAGIARFEAAHRLLEAAGVRTPRVHLLDPDRTRFPYDVAIVEDVGDTSLEDLLARDADAAAPALDRLGAMLDVMRQASGTGARPGPGSGTGDRPGPLPAPPSCEAVVLRDALGHLAAAAGRVPRLAGVRDRLATALYDLAAAVPPRERHGVVHGELGPDHVLVDGAGRPVLIDIEGTTVFDVEWEHAFLRLRFGPHYPALRVPDLDDARLRFYALARYLSLVEGPLRLLDGDFPDRAAMLAIAAANTERALSFVGGSGGHY
jgi:hypothetical protein